jgi:hypothetical protein
MPQIIKNRYFHFTSNNYDGGGIAVNNLHSEMLSNGIHSFLFIKEANNVIDKTYLIKSKSKIINLQLFLKKILRKFDLLKHLDFFLNNKSNFNLRPHFDEISHDFLKKFIITKNDIFIIYGINNVVDFKFLEKIKNNKIFIYPLDMEPLTGGCHFNFNCVSHLNLCNKCQIDNYKNKYSFYNSAKVKFIASNKGVYSLMQSISSINNNQLYLSYLITKISRYQYIDQKTARKFFNLPDNKYIILNLSINSSDIRKNNSLFFQLVEHFKDNTNFYFLYISNNCPIKHKSDNFRFIKSNFNDYYMNYIYRSCNLLLDLSLSDNGPIVCQEAFLNDMNIITNSNSLISCSFKEYEGVYLSDNTKDDVINNILLSYADNFLYKDTYKKKRDMHFLKPKTILNHFLTL